MKGHEARLIVIVRPVRSVITRIVMVAVIRTVAGIARVTVAAAVDEAAGEEVASRCTENPSDKLVASLRFGLAFSHPDAIVGFFLPLLLLLLLLMVDDVRNSLIGIEVCARGIVHRNPKGVLGSLRRSHAGAGVRLGGLACSVGLFFT